MSKKAWLEYLGLTHRDQHRPVDPVEVRLSGQRTTEIALSDRDEEWLRKCDSDKLRALDEIERGWKLFGMVPVSGMRYEERTDKAIHNFDLSSHDIDLIQFVREFETKMALYHRKEWQAFEGRFKRGWTWHYADTHIRKRNGTASAYCHFILREYCNARKWGEFAPVQKGRIVASDHQKIPFNSELYS